MKTPADRQPATLVLDAARMRLAVATARAAEADQHATVHAEAARRRRHTLEQLVKLRATAGRLSVQIAANQREAAAAAEQLTHPPRGPLARWRHRRQPRDPDDPYLHLRRLTASQLDAHLRHLSTDTADLLARLGRIAARQRQAQAQLTRPEPQPLLSPAQIANRRAELAQATNAHAQTRDRTLPAPDATTADDQAATANLTRKAADRMADQLTAYLTGPGQNRAHWTRQVGLDETPYWTTGDLYNRWWAVHVPDPARHPTADPKLVDPGFLTALGQAVATVAAAEQRPTSAVITDILTTGRTRTTQATSPAADAALAQQWQTHTPRARAPRVIAQPTRAQRLDPAIGKVFARAYRQAWHHHMHTLLIAEGTAALTRLAKHGHPPPPPLPHDRDQSTQLYDQITTDSVENYLTGHGWHPLDQTATVRRWHNGADAIIEVPTGSGSIDRQAMLRATAYTLAEHEQREAGEVLVELTDPPLRDPQLARVHTLLTNPPSLPDTQVADRLATAHVPTGGAQMPLAEYARHQLATLGASDAVWKLATATGQADATTRVAQLLGTTPPARAPTSPLPLFAAGPAEPAEQVAARIWAAGTGLPPAQHARWFARTWWPYHLTGTTNTFAAYLTGRLGHQPPAAPPAPGGPDHQLFKATDAAAIPERSSHDRFVATYRIVDAACRPRAVQAATQAVRDHLAGADLPVDEAALATAAVHAGDPRRFAHPPTEVTLRAALTTAWPAEASQLVPAASRPRPPAFPPLWKALASTSRPATPGPSDVVDPIRHRQRQLVTTAADAAHAGRVPTPPPMRTAPTTRGTHR